MIISCVCWSTGGALYQAEASRLKDEVVKGDTELSAAQEPLYSLKDQRASLLMEERAKKGMTYHLWKSI